jgi:hypothetical protein
VLRLLSVSPMDVKCKVLWIDDTIQYHINKENSERNGIENIKVEISFFWKDNELDGIPKEQQNS